MAKTKESKLEFHKHIDNGGVSVNAAVDKLGNVTVEFSTEYHGYPSVVSTFRDYGHMSTDDYIAYCSSLFEYCQPQEKIGG